MSAPDIANLPLTISWFETAMPSGPALGDPERTTWGEFISVCEWRREGEKGGPGFVPCTFMLESDGRQVRRLKAHLIARTAIALDIETNGTTGEIPPSLNEVVERVRALGLTCLIYTSHNHHPVNSIRYRLVFPLSAEISHDLLAPEVMADCLGLLNVLDLSKIGAQSLFYLPSSPHGLLDQHQTIVVAGNPVIAAWITERADALLVRRQAEAERRAGEANAQAAARRAARLAAGFSPDDSLIEKLRPHFDLDSVLRGHGYDSKAVQRCQPAPHRV